MIETAGRDHDAPAAGSTDPTSALFEPPPIDAPARSEEPRRQPVLARFDAGWRSLRSDPVQVIVLLVPVVIFVVGAWVHRFVTEDGFINLHIVQQIDAGNGPNFNPGERVEAFTSPLYIAVLTVVRALFGWALPLENLTVIIGLVSSTVALVLGMAGSARLASLVGPIGSKGDAPSNRTARQARWLVPVGALVFACTPPMWRWATSGLETSLSFVWISLCFWGLVRRYHRHPSASLLAPDRPIWLLLVVGLGPLVRPEFIVYSLAFLLGIWFTSSGGWVPRLRSIAWTASIAVLYQIFRMGYYAALVPNTALAKNSGASEWARGVKYGQEFLAREWLWIALAALVALLAVAVVSAVKVDRRLAALYGAPLVGALLNGLYVLRVGGDYMYARWWVPAWVALLAPVAVVAVPRRLRDMQTSVVLGVAVTAMAVMIVWSAGATYNGKILDATTGLGFGDYGMLLPGETNPVNPRDYGFAYAGMEDIIRRFGANADVLYDSTDASHPPIRLRAGQGIVIKSGAIGAGSYVAGPDVWIVDDRGLADTFGSRLKNNELLPIPGHEKLLSWDYIVARWAPPEPTDSPKVVAARKAMQCQPLNDLIEATTEPMSVGRFFKNIAKSRELTSLRISADAAEFQAEACRG